MLWTDISKIAKGNLPSPPGRGSTQFAVYGENMFSVGCFDQNGKVREIAACISFEFDTTNSFFARGRLFLQRFLNLKRGDFYLVK
jgi:hypothetical protein